MPSDLANEIRRVASEPCRPGSSLVYVSTRLLDEWAAKVEGAEVPEVERLQARVAELEGLVKELAPDPGEAPCSCCCDEHFPDLRGWCGCDCGNHEDAQRMAVWCSEKRRCTRVAAALGDG